MSKGIKKKLNCSDSNINSNPTIINKFKHEYI